MLAVALSWIGRVSDEIGTCAVLLGVFDCVDPNFVVRRRTYYEFIGFAWLPDLHLRKFMPIVPVRALFGSVV